MIVEDTKDLVETDDYVIIEATLSEGDLLFVQIAVGIRNEVARMGNWVPVCAICPSGILCRIRS